MVDPVEYGEERHACGCRSAWIVGEAAGWKEYCAQHNPFRDGPPPPPSPSD